MAQCTWRRLWEVRVEAHGFSTLLNAYFYVRQQTELMPFALAPDWKLQSNRYTLSMEGDGSREIAVPDLLLVKVPTSHIQNAPPIRDTQLRRTRLGRSGRLLALGFLSDQLPASWQLRELLARGFFCVLPVAILDPVPVFCELL